MVTTLRTGLSRLTKSEEGAPLLSPVPEGAEAKLPASDDGENGAEDENGDNSEPCESGGAEEIFTTSTNCEEEESVTEIADAVVNPHEMNSVYGDVLSHLIALPFEAQSMLKFHRTKESSKSNDGRRKRKKPSRQNTVPIYSQKQYLRGAGRMTLSTADLAWKETKKKSRTVKSSPKRVPVLHSNRTDCAEFSPPSVKTLESPKRGVSQSPRQQDATNNTDHFNSYVNQDMTAIQEQALAQTQQQQLLMNDHRDIALLHQEHELQLLLQQQQLHHQQQPAYYDPLQAVHHHLYHQMLMSYPFNPYLPYQQPGYQHISPQLLQPFLHGGYVNNPDDVLAAALSAAEAANQNDSFLRAPNGFVAYPNNSDCATLPTEAAYQNAHLPVTCNDYAATATAAPPAENHSTTTADLSTNMNAGTTAAVSNATSTAVATASPEQKLTKSNKPNIATLPQASERNVDNDESNFDADVSTTKRAVQDEGVVGKMKLKEAVAWPKNEERNEERNEKQKKASSDNTEMKDNSKVFHSPKDKQNGQSSGNLVGNSAGADFPPGWTTSTHPRKTGRGCFSHFVSPNNNVFRSRKNAIAFVAILAELKKKNDGKDPSESEALAVFDRRGHKR
mmetsp:Transcript_5467/g.9245  ORF Transcript_5467/g.9245 Transcript_5467/m.9245 type:complete len:618 (-) Transcript_5467:70-1923(-)